MPTSGPTYSHAAFASGTNHTRIDQRITPHNLPAPADANQVREAWFYSAIFGTRFGGGGYIGIQKDSNGQRAIFSIWNSLSAGTFDPAGQVYYGTNEPPGTYYRITIPYNWVAGHTYELSIRKSTTANYWDGWITDITTGTAKQIGYQQVPAGWGDLHESIDNFVEWFGSQPSACDKYPYCSVTFSLPTSSVGPATWVRADDNNGACPATISADGTGKRHELGANTAAPPPLPPAPPPPPPTAPPPPTDLGISGTTTASAVHLQWKLPSDADATVIYRSFGGGAWGAIGYVLRASGTSYTDSTVAAGTAYSYKVRVSNSAGTSGDSNIVTVTTPAAPAPPPPVVAPATPLVRVAHPADVDAAVYATDRGRDCRAYDRTEEREVYGPHRFDSGRLTDLGITNGLVWAWCGNRGAPAFLNVAIWHDSADAWIEQGTVSLGAGALLGARLVRCSPEAATIALDIAGQGEAFVTLARGARSLICLARSVSWSPVPPTVTPPTGSGGTGRFGRGLSFSGGSGSDVRLLWPPDVAKKRWTVALWWLPAAATSAQGTSGIVRVDDSAGTAAAVAVQFDGVTKRMVFGVGTASVSSSPLTFSANQALFIAARFDALGGMALTVRPLAGTIQHVATGGPLSPNTLVDYHTIRQLSGGGTLYGEGLYGEGLYGGVASPQGVIDNLMVFDDMLDDAECTSLAGAQAALDGLPAPEGRLRLYAPFDSFFAPALTTAPGEVAETLFANGLKRAVVSLGAASPNGLGLVATKETTFGAVVATAAEGDDVFDYHAQLDAQNRQLVRMG